MRPAEGKALLANLDSLEDASVLELLKADVSFK
jgi:hypothetical protein